MAPGPGSDPEALFGEAVNLAIRLRTEPGTAARDSLAAFRARSPEHERIWQEIAEIHGMAATLLAPEDTRRFSRRRLLGLGAAGLGLAAAGGILVPEALLAARADHRTRVGEIDEITLGDGSLLVLGPDSAVQLAFAGGGRGLRLLAGMLYCEIAARPGPEFQLSWGGLRLSSPGGVLSLSEEAGGLSLALESGEIALGGGAPQPKSGERLRFGSGGALLSAVPEPAPEASAWRLGRVVIEDESLAVVTARLARWLPGRVVIADPALGSRRVSGVFNLADPHEALRAAISPHGGQLRQLTPWLTLISRL